jgi:hypothetical protein
MNDNRDCVQRELLVITGDLDKISENNPEWLMNAIIELYDTKNLIVSQKKISTFQSTITLLPKDLQDATALILFALNDATVICTQAIKNLTSAEIRFLADTRDVILEENIPDIPELSEIFMDLIRGPLSLQIDESEKDVVARYNKIIDKINMENILMAFLSLTESIKIALPVILRYQNFDFDFSFCDPLGLVRIEDNGEDIYNSDTILSIDLGGNDRYYNNAGGGYQDVAITIDLQGDDFYTGEKNIQGSGFLGAGILIDMQGNDTYHSQSWSQGAAFGGVGILVDMIGDDTFISDSFSQGSAAAKGIGLAADYTGDDFWCATSFSQGKASEEGLGCLVDIYGDDIYLSHEDSQGRGIYQGKGLLLDVFGDDSYIAANNSQGSGELGGTNDASIGILLDSSGNDIYEAQQSSQGFGRYSGIGVLSDFTGNDNYSARKSSQAFGGIAGIGILMDFDGNDAYSPINYLNELGFGLSFQLDNEGTNIYCKPRDNTTLFVSNAKSNLLAGLLEWSPEFWHQKKLEMRNFLHDILF